MSVKVYIDGEFYCNTKSHHVDSVVYSLESEGVLIIDEYWDGTKVYLTTGDDACAEFGTTEASA